MDDKWLEWLKFRETMESFGIKKTTLDALEEYKAKMDENVSFFSQKDPYRQLMKEFVTILAKQHGYSLEQLLAEIAEHWADSEISRRETQE